MPVVIDFETRCELSVKKVGPHAYASHPSTEPICLAYAIDDDSVRIWHPEFSFETGEILRAPGMPADLKERVTGGDLIEAHNAMFERCVWHYVMHLRYGWPDVREEQWRCSAAVAAAHALPRSLEKAALALDLPHKKDMEGNATMKKMSRPRKPSKNDPARWHHREVDFARVYAYCMDDVKTERALSKALPKLKSDELEVWKIDQKMNWRGVRVDLGVVRGALRIMEQEQRRVDRGLQELTLGEVSKHTQRDRFRKWLQGSIPWLSNTQAQTLKDILEAGWVEKTEDGTEIPLPPDVRKAIELWLDANKASIKKFKAMRDRVAPDGRVHDHVMYCGASTGRWSGKGVQTQNVKRGYGESSIDSMCNAIRDEDIEWLRSWEGNALEALSLSVRGAFCAEPGSRLLASDYSAIEARGTFWLAGQEDALEVFRGGGDIYCYTAGEFIFFRDVTKDDKFERFVGKQSVLGLGYQMGWPTWIKNNHNYGVEIPEEQARSLFGDEYEMIVKVALTKKLPPDAENNLPHLVSGKWRPLIRSLRFHRTKLWRESIHEQAFAAYVVQAYRSGYSKVPKMWKGIEEAAVSACADLGRTTRFGPIKFRASHEWLQMRLPSGRCLFYREPRLRDVRTPWGESRKQITHMSVDGPNRKWRRIGTYGGKLTENAVQALSRDIMAHAMVRLEAAGYPLTMTVHDELVAERGNGEGSLSEFNKIMAEPPKWAKGFPVAVDGWEGYRYRK